MSASIGYVVDKHPTLVLHAALFLWTFILRFHFQSSTWKYGTTSKIVLTFPSFFPSTCSLSSSFMAHSRQLDSESSKMLHQRSGNAACYCCVNCEHTQTQSSRSISWISMLAINAVVSFSIIATLLHVPSVASKFHTQANFCSQDILQLSFC